MMIHPMPRLRHVVATLLVSVLVSSCSGEPSAVDRAKDRERKEDSWKFEMQRRLAAKLKDPDSATFRNVFLSKKTDAPVVCGEVNSRNSFGGMTGFQRFISAGEIQVVEEQMANGEFGQVWSQFCR